MFGAGVIPHTQWNVAATGIQGQLLASRATLLTDYVDSEVTSFDLKSFYYRCILNSAESAASTPVSYQITISSFDADGNGVPTQQFTFTATGLLQNMEQAILSDDFRGLDRVELDTDAAVNTLIATLFDDYECVVYKGERPHSKNPEESSKPAESESLQEMPSSEEAKKPEASECSNQTTGCEESKSSGQWL